LSPSTFFIDQLSAGIPLLRILSPKTRILFYCHFPDKLLAKKEGLIKSFYRVPFDLLESWSTGCSDGIVVNSKFTKGIFGEAFPYLKNRDPKVVYPCVDTNPNSKDARVDIQGPLWKGDRILLSINRFERKKDIALALRAYAALSVEERESSRLVIAGGYDHRVAENVSYLKELCELASHLGLRHVTAKTIVTALSVPSDIQVIFFLSVPNPVKEKLLASAKLLIYTPRNEHLGIVPLEAMLSGVPVLAANEGGPTETVVEGQTGWLRDVSKPEQWTEVMRTVLNGSLSDSSLQKMGYQGRQRVKHLFSKDKMASRLDEELTSILANTTRPSIFGSYSSIWITILLVLLGVGSASLFHSWSRN
jgi:alpha-1,3/alpha-1,6-mannosyltransferase